MTLISEKTKSSEGDQMEKMDIHIFSDRCAGCQECVVRCPTNALKMDSLSWTVVAEDELCVGCRQCERTCPFTAIKINGPVMVDVRIKQEHFKPMSIDHNADELRLPIKSFEDAKKEAMRCLDCPDPTCLRGCPAHNDIPSFIRAVREGNLQEAHSVLSRTSVLPDVCSRVCDQATQCEGSCSWSLAGKQPVAIGLLERFITENADFLPLEKGNKATGLEVAIIGSGPAGIAAATELVKQGAKVTVFEKDSTPGGLITWGIPDFTLPHEVAKRPWDRLINEGVNLKVNTEIKEAEVNDLLGNYDALIIACGASQPIKLPVEGGDLKGVVDATTFLKNGQEAINNGSSISEIEVLGLKGVSSPHILVLGAGNTAMDVARTARRLGASVRAIDWMDQKFAPVRPDELAEAKSEGVEITFSSTLVSLTGNNGRVSTAKIAKTTQTSAKELPKVQSGSTSDEKVDLVVMAMGYRVDPDIQKALNGAPIRKKPAEKVDRRWIASGIFANPAPEFARGQNVGVISLSREIANQLSMIPRRPRMWVVGDALIGPATVVEAMAHGRDAARAIITHKPSKSGGSEVGLYATKTAKVLIAVESRGGTTLKIGEAIQKRISSSDVEVRVQKLNTITMEDIAWADHLILGTWVEGFVVAKVGLPKFTKAWLKTLPPLGGLPTSIYVTYSFNPKDVLGNLAKELEGKGAKIQSKEAFKTTLGGTVDLSGIDNFASSITGQKKGAAKVTTR